MGHGSVLAGRYRLDERVRTRPDGSMWRALDETLERPVLVQAFALGHPQAGEIVDAARRAALVPDPRLQRVLAAGEERGTAYVVLERVPGRTLEELLGAGPLPAETARRIVGEAAQALDRASTRGLHHLKLRPGTIIVGRDGVVTVSGTAIDAAAAGTEPPNTAVARRVDAVGLVTVLYAALTGRWPGPQEGRLPRAPRIGGRAVAPGDLVAGVPNDLDTLCAVTLGPYDDGPRTPSDLAAELAPWAPPGPLTDPRGLHIAIPRPDASGSARVVPATPDADRDEAPPGAPHAPGRTPAWGLRAARLRSRAASGTAVAASVTEAGDAETPAAAGAAAAPAGDRRPGIRSWATVEELRAALRSSTRGVAGGDGVPLAETPPPVGTPLTWWTPPAGAPSATTPPAGGPLAPAVPPSVPVAGPPAPPAPPAPSVAAPAPEAAGSPRPSTAPPTGPSGPSARTAPSSAVVDADLRPGEPRPRARPRHSDVAAAAAASGEPRAQARVDSGAPPPAEPWTAAPTVSRRDAGADSPRESRPAPSPPSSPPSSPPPGSGRGPGVETSPPPARRRRRPPVAARPRSPRTELLTGVEALDILGAAAQPVEPVAPFGPATPVARPPREQSRLVVLVLATLVFILGGFAVTRFLTFDAAPLITQDGGAPATPRATAGNGSTPASASPSGGATPSPGGTVNVAGAAAIDPQGDGNENGDLAKNVIDGDRSTSWHSERYNSPTFGGIKQGVGLALELGDTSTVTSVTVYAPGDDGSLELRSSDSGRLDGSRVIADGQLNGSGSVTLTPAQPVPTRYLILWFTRVPQNGGERRIVVDEVDVR